MPRGWRAGWVEACSAGGGAADVCAVSEHSGLVVLSPGLGLELHGRQGGPGKPWKQAAGTAHLERPAAVPGADAGLPPG